MRRIRSSSSVRLRVIGHTSLFLLAHQTILGDDVLPREEERGERVPALGKLTLRRGTGQHPRVAAEVEDRVAPVGQGKRVGGAHLGCESARDLHHGDRRTANALLAYPAYEAAARAQVDAGVAVGESEDRDGGLVV